MVHTAIPLAILSAIDRGQQPVGQAHIVTGGTPHMRQPTVTLGEMLGGIEATDALMALVENSTIEIVTATRLERETAEAKVREAAAKAARKAKWEADLVSRCKELLEWSRKDTTPCDFCQWFRNQLKDVGKNPPGELVIFTADLPAELELGTEEKLKLAAHDRYHLCKALGAIRKAEFEARQARRAERVRAGHQGFASKAERNARLSDAKRAERHWNGMVAARTQAKGLQGEAVMAIKKKFDDVLKEANNDYIMAVRTAKAKGLNKA